MTLRRQHEIEIKLRVADPAALGKRLRALGARLISRVHERNTLFDTVRQRLRKQGYLLRLRQEYRPGTTRRPIRVVLTCKGPSLRAAKRPASGLGGAGAGSRLRYKVRQEMEAVVSDHTALGAILGALGLVPCFHYEKYRSAYRLPGRPNLLIDLDETPIGLFLELEGSPSEIDRAARLLGYSRLDYLVSSYVGLYLEYCRRRGGSPGDMLFPRSRSRRE